MTWDREYDATGLRCPLPVLKARGKLRWMARGKVLRVIVDDPMAAIDLPHFCAEQGHDLVGTEDLEGATAYLIRRGSGRRPGSGEKTAG